MNAPDPTLRENPLSPPPPSRILVVDDEPTIRLGIEFSLTTEGFEVETAADGDEAIRRLIDSPEEELPDAMILDLRMPGADGMQVMRRLAGSGRVLPVAIASAYIDSPTAIEAVDLGVVDFLKKPITPNEVRGLVAQMVAEELRFGPLTDSDETAIDVPDDPKILIAAARCCLRRRKPRHAVRLLRRIPPETESDISLWLMITEHLLAADHPDEESFRAPASDSFYHAANLLDFLAYNENWSREGR